MRFASLRAGLVACAGIVGLGLADGGFHPQAWSWASFGLVWLLGMMVVVGAAVRWSVPEVVTVAALGGLTGWIALSAVWSEDAQQTLREGERALLYVAALTVVLALARDGSEQYLLGGVLAAVAAITIVALVGYLFLSGSAVPDRFEGYLLFEPVGYANALGLLAALGVTLALGLATHARHDRVRAGCAASLIPLTATLALTASRGAWLALGVGLLVLVAVDSERQRLLAVLTLFVLILVTVVWLTSKADLHANTPRFQADAAQRLGLALVAVMAATALLARPIFALVTRVRRRRLGSSRLWLMSIGAAALGVGVFAASRASGDTIDLGLHDRAAYWRVAWEGWTAQPVIGGGAGTFARAWQSDPTRNAARDAHSLYLETLSELGLVGLALLAVALGAPLVAARIAWDRTLTPTALAAYIVFVVHAGLDWDWEMPVVTLAGLCCGAALLVAARPSSSIAVDAKARSWMFAPVGILLVIAVVELIANDAVSL